MAHFGASSFAGLVSAVFSTPIDVVRTRLMNQAGTAHEDSGVVDALINIPRKEGVAALYKGFWPLFMRKVLWTVSFFLTYEQIKAAVAK